MGSPDLIQRVIFLAPVPIVILLLMVLKFPWRMGLLIWLVGTFLQDVLTFMLNPGAVSTSELPGLILAMYSFGLFPLGLWAAIVGVVCWAVAVQLGWPLELDRARQFYLAIFFGAVIGFSFAFVAALLTKLVGPISADRGWAWLSWEIAGSITGTASGIIVAFFLPHKESPNARIWRWPTLKQKATSTQSRAGTALRP